MKKFLIALLAFVLLIGCMLSFASCEEKEENEEKEEKLSNIGTKPELDISDAMNALEDEYYEVKDRSDSILEVGMEESFYASKGESYFTMISFETEELAKIYYKGLKLEYDSELENIKLQIEYYEYLLENYEDELDSDEIDEYEDEIKDLQKELDEMENELSCGISKNVVWYGNNDAAEATRGSADDEN